jgi:glycosyltransferase involved in cell wall biosynthesis
MINTKNKPFTRAVPKVSIGMPVFNGATYIQQAINSLISQSFSNFELIISDNASTDETQAICKKFAKLDDRIKYIRQTENLGAINNFRLVLNEAEGEYFMWAAADDFQETDFVRLLVDTLDEHKNLVCVMTDVRNIHEDDEANGFVTEISDIRLKSVLDNWSQVQTRFFRNPTSNIFFCVYGMFRTNSIKSISLDYYGKIKFASSIEISILAQLAVLGKIASLPVKSKIYRRNKTSVYHQEQQSINEKERLKIFINVSRCLLEITAKSHLRTLQKLKLISTTITSSLLWLVKYVVKKLFKKVARLVLRNHYKKLLR